MTETAIFVSILVLVHNAPEYVELTIRSVREKTSGIDYEIVVVDNASESPTKELLRRLDDEGLIDVLHFSDENTLFAGGNNVAASRASKAASHFLLLNSDVEIRDRSWLTNLYSKHQRGATAYGIARDPLRVDGYCLLIDADLYRKIPLDEGHQWWWSVTKQQAALLRAGYSVAGFYEHERYLHHFGGKSGSAFASARGMNVTRAEVSKWFGGLKPNVLDTLPSVSVRARVSELARRAKRRLSRVWSR